MKRNLLIISAVLLAMVASLLLLRTRARPAQSARELSQAQFVEKLQSNLLVKVEVHLPSLASQPAEIRGRFYEMGAAGQVLMEQGERTEVPFHAVVDLRPDLELRLSTNRDISFMSLNPYLDKANKWLHRSN